MPEHLPDPAPPPLESRAAFRVRLAAMPESQRLRAAAERTVAAHKAANCPGCLYCTPITEIRA